MYIQQQHLSTGNQDPGQKRLSDDLVLLRGWFSLIAYRMNNPSCERASLSVYDANIAEKIEHLRECKEI